MQMKYNLTLEQKIKFGDICSALFGIIFQEGGFVIPFISGVMVDAVGFERMCCFSAMIPLLFAVVFASRCKAHDLTDNGVTTETGTGTGKKIDVV